MINQLPGTACSRFPAYLLCALVLAFLMSSQLVKADILARMEPVVLAPGALLTYPIVRGEVSGRRVEIALAGGPDSARLTVSDKGELLIVWQSDLGPDGEAVFNLTAIDVDTGELLESRYLLIRSGQVPERPVVPPLQLGPFESQNLVFGDAWQFPLGSRDFARADIEILAGGLPGGAILTYSSDVGYVLRWTPDNTQQGTHRVRLRALQADNPDNYADATLELFVSAPVMSRDELKLGGSYLQPLANQVVSAGRVVTFKVVPTLMNTADLILHVDRLPRNASFEDNNDGSRTFYWKTSDRDQGEHLFRFTAIDIDNPHLRSYAEVLVVVGDPSRNKTFPTDKMLRSE